MGYVINILGILIFMINQSLISKEYIIKCLKNNYGINTSSITKIAEGADLDSQVYKADTEDRKTYFIKAGLNHDISTSLQLLLHDKGIKQVISPIKTLDNKLFQNVNDFNLVVYPYISGKCGFKHKLNKNQWIELGKALKQIHEFDIPLLIREKIKHENYSPEWRDAIRSIYNNINFEKSNDPTILSFLSFIKNQKEIILHLVHIAEKLAQKIKKKDVEFVLCHSDIHAGNVLIQNDGKIFIVDWDYPKLAPKERDLMFIGGGIGNVWNSPNEVVFFYKGYGTTKIDIEMLSYYRCERIIEDIAIYYKTMMDSNKNNKAEIYDFIIDMFKPNGVVDIALKSVDHVHHGIVND